MAWQAKGLSGISGASPANQVGMASRAHSCPGEQPEAVLRASASEVLDSPGVSQYSYLNFQARACDWIGKVQSLPVQGLASRWAAPELNVESRLSEIVRVSWQ